MKKLILMSLALLMPALTMSGQAYSAPRIGDNWSAGVSVGVASPVKGHSFFGNMRPTVGLDGSRRLTPAFSLGAEALFGFNTSRWPGLVHSTTAFDRSYVGVYGAIDLMRLGSRPCSSRFFSLGIQAGCGWGHDFRTAGVPDHNFFATKAGLFVGLNVSPRFSVNLAPSVLWDMSDARSRQSSAAYSGRQAVFNLQAGVRYSFGPGFQCVPIYDPAQVDALNGQINSLRASLGEAAVQVETLRAENARLTSQLDECRAKKPEVVKEVSVNNRFNTERDIFFLLGSATITPDQMPNVELVAAYLKNHPGSRVVIKGYASRDGNHGANVRLAAKRAESVRAALIKHYHIAPDRISASGAGIGDLFDEEAWNRVSVCTLENK